MLDLEKMFSAVLHKLRYRDSNIKCLESLNIGLGENKSNAPKPCVEAELSFFRSLNIFA